MSVLQTEWTSAAIDKHDFLNSNINIEEKSNKRDDDEHARESIDQQQHSTPTQEDDRTIGRSASRQRGNERKTLSDKTYKHPSLTRERGSKTRNRRVLTFCSDFM